MKLFLIILKIIFKNVNSKFYVMQIGNLKIIYNIYLNPIKYLLSFIVEDFLLTLVSPLSPQITMPLWKHILNIDSLTVWFAIIDNQVVLLFQKIGSKAQIYLKQLQNKLSQLLEDVCLATQIIIYYYSESYESLTLSSKG